MRGKSRPTNFTIHTLNTPDLVGLAVSFRLNERPGGELKRRPIEQETSRDCGLSAPRKLNEMPVPNVCVLRAPGTNCDIETAFAFDSCGGRSDRIHLFQLLERPALLDDYQILCVPGGFSYGDDIGAGVVFASQMRNHLGDAIRRFLSSDKLTLGICNGFQTLLKAGILPGGTPESFGAERESADATLTWNLNGKYTARWVHLRVSTVNNAFLRGIEEIDLPIAHAEGRIVVKNENVVCNWKNQGQVALTYGSWAATDAGNVTHPVDDRWPANPNGSTNDIAGLGDPSGRVLGLMPHPERFLFGTQHPHWTRLGRTADGDGRKIFQNAIDYLA
jgi:phosphoribosylformylglycinamidine synthase subunit PurQ / glutaminase